jgi:hypothetical protein
MGKLNSTTIVKIGVVVRNIEDVAKRYGELFNVPTPKVNIPDPEKPVNPGTYKRFRGKEYKVLLKHTRIDLDPIYLEVIEPYDDTPSPWLEHLNKFGPSVCFISFFIKGFREEIQIMANQGYPQIFEEEKGHERYAYFDTLEKLGITVELKERDAQ